MRSERLEKEAEKKERCRGRFRARVGEVYTELKAGKRARLFICFGFLCFAYVICQKNAGLETENADRAHYRALYCVCVCVWKMGGNMRKNCQVMKINETGMGNVRCGLKARESLTRVA